MNSSNKSRRKKVGVYRYYNMTASDYGEPFGLCEKHFKEERVPESWVLNKLSADGFMPCNKCMEI